MPVQLSEFAQAIYKQKYSLDGREEWDDTAWRVATNVLSALGYGPRSDEVAAVFDLMRDRKFLPGGRYLYASGRDLHQVQNCLLLRAEDSREGWGELWQKGGTALMTGAGIGVDYSEVREEGAPVSRTGGFASGPVSLMHTVNEIGRQVMQGGSRRSAIWAGLNWRHPDVLKFIRVKDWSPETRALKEQDLAFPMPMELTNISVLLDDDFFTAYAAGDSLAHEVYWAAVKRMATTGEPGFSVDVGADGGETLRNACTEVTSRDDSDVCNLGSLNLARLGSAAELADAVEVASLFLLAGTVYSHVPYERVAEVRSQNRRLGLGIMGLHEWLIQRGKPYAPDVELGEWLTGYARSTEVAGKIADAHGLSRPVKTRSVAPTGTIAIIAETTTGIEPVFCRAYKRRYVVGRTWRHQYVVDPTVARAVDEYGVDPDDVEDAYELSADVPRRLAMQSFTQRYVDHAISSTVNLHAPLTDPADQRRFGEELLAELPALRGVTCYPDGARNGQPLEVTSYNHARRSTGVVFEEDDSRCVGGACGV